MSEYNDSIPADLLEHESRAGSRRPLVAVTSIVLAVVLAGLSLVMPFLISSFESIFEDMGVQLPWLTQAVLAVPDIAWIVVGAAGVVAIVAKDRVVSSGVALVFNAVVFLVGATFVAAAVVGLIVPLLEITRSIE